MENKTIYLTFQYYILKKKLLNIQLLSDINAFIYCLFLYQYKCFFLWQSATTNDDAKSKVTSFRRFLLMHIYIYSEKERQRSRQCLNSKNMEIEALEMSQNGHLRWYLVNKKYLRIILKHIRGGRPEKGNTSLNDKAVHKKLQKTHQFILT